MADVTLDAKGLVCPLPVAKVQQKAREMKPGQTLEVIADCHSFPEDVRKWCESTGHPLISINSAGAVTTAVIKF